MDRYKIIKAKRVVPEKKRLPAIFCGINTSNKLSGEEVMTSPFCMVWIYLPQGPKLYCGSIEKIKMNTSNLPLCHGMVLTYNKIRGMKLVTKGWDLFGKGHKNYYMVSNDLSKSRDERKTTKLGHKTMGVIREFRKVPNQYLSCFKAIDEAMNLKVSKEDKKFASEFLEALKRW